MNYQKFIIYCYLLVFFTIIAKVYGNELKFAGWAEKCKIQDRISRVPLNPWEECNAEIGLVCREYTQGHLCGCNDGLSYDRRSRECRRPVRSYCHQAKDKESYAKLSFNKKCHDTAECRIDNSTLIGSKNKKYNGPICICKLGYYPSEDNQECRDPNHSSIFKASLSSLLLPTIFGLIYYNINI